MRIELREPYRKRSIHFVELLHAGAWRLKVYTIASGPGGPAPALLDASRDVARQLLNTARTRHTTYGVGILGVHDGRGENQVFLDRWCNENELLHHYWISPKDDPARLIVPDADHNSVCVWDLALQCFERQAWIECVLDNPTGPDIEAYLERRMSAEV